MKEGWEWEASNNTREGDTKETQKEKEKIKKAKTPKERKKEGQ